MKKKRIAKTISVPQLYRRFPDDAMLPPQIATPPQEHEALRAALAIARGEAEFRIHRPLLETPS